ncbi:MAG TPA: PilZ domain-containing protein [Pyrinomonadaceae bacterium]|nr:PilZ domain-containing protein [Pyrinomonadaceae bacterium]
MPDKGAKFEGKSRRSRERFALALPCRVHCRESVNHEWQEISRLVDVTQFGARLRLKRPTEQGRLLLLTLAMPRQLRCFDHVEEQYRVWSLVRNVRILDPAAAQGTVVEFGVAFVGKHPPRAFAAAPARRYEINTAMAAGLWTIQEESDNLLSEIDISDKRKDTRHNIPIDLTIDVFGENGTFPESESTVTENISRTGASVFTALPLEVGRFVKVSSPRMNTSVIGVVRTRRVGADGITRLHLEFVGGEWPL